MGHQRSAGRRAGGRAARTHATYGQHVAVRLSADDDLGLYVPPGVAHGYQTLVDDTSLTLPDPGRATPPTTRGRWRWDDPVVAVDWPQPVTRISEKDRQGHPWPPA